MKIKFVGREGGGEERGMEGREGEISWNDLHRDPNAREIVEDRSDVKASSFELLSESVETNLVIDEDETTIL